MEQTNQSVIAKSEYAINFAFSFKRNGQSIAVGTSYPIIADKMSILIDTDETNNSSSDAAITSTIGKALWNIIHGMMPAEFINQKLALKFGFKYDTEFRKSVIKENFEAVEKLVIVISNNGDEVYTKEYEPNKQQITVEEIDRDILEVVKAIVAKEEYELQYIYYIDNAVTNEQGGDDEHYSIVSSYEKVFKHEDGSYFTTSADTRLTEVLVKDILGFTEKVDDEKLYETQMTLTKDAIRRVREVRVKLYNQFNRLISSAHYSIGDDVESLVDLDIEVNKLLNRIINH